MVYADAAEGQSVAAAVTDPGAGECEIPIGMMVWIVHQNQVGKIVQRIGKKLEREVGPNVGVYRYERLSAEQRERLADTAAGFERSLRLR